jgi:hypothetical protein
MGGSYTYYSEAALVGAAYVQPSKGARLEMPVVPVRGYAVWCELMGQRILRENQEANLQVHKRTCIGKRAHTPHMPLIHRPHSLPSFTALIHMPLIHRPHSPPSFTALILRPHFTAPRHSQMPWAECSA